MAKVPFRMLLGKLMWGAKATRLDLSQPVHDIARFQSKPGLNHWKALLHILVYVKVTLDYGITYRSDGTLRPIGYVNASYGHCTDTGRSTGGYVFTIAGGPVSWSSKRQSVVALSTMEAEYMAMTRAGQYAVWLYGFLNEIGLPQEMPAIIYGDNMATITLTQHSVGHLRAKHINLKYHWLRE